MKKAVFFKPLQNRTVECRACSWQCRIAPGRVGVCGTRYNQDGVLYSLVYGKAIGLHLDPVEKKPLFHFSPGSTLLSFGTVGCNFGCLFCQNWEMSQINKVQSLKLKVQSYKRELTALIERMSVAISPSEIVKMAERQGAGGIAYTYNEPAIFVEFAHDTAKLAKKRGLRNVYVSNGFESQEAFEYIKDYLDAINIDLKSFREDFYLRICKSRLEPVLQNIERFFKSGIETEVTTLIIPGQNDSVGELAQIAKWLCGISQDIPWHLSAFYPAYKMMDIPPTPHETLIRAYDIGKKAGLRYVYLGNVLDAARSSTFCPKCEKLLVERIGYEMKITGLDQANGRCRFCREQIYGLWEA